MVGSYTAPVMILSSDPHGWLRPFEVTLKADPAFNMLALPLRFAALCELVAVEHHERTAWMRDWSPAAQQGTLKWLESATKEKRPVTARKRGR